MEYNTNSSYLSGRELIERWRVRPIDLQTMISEGKLYYTFDGQQLECGYIYGSLGEVYFPKNDIHEYEKKHPELKPQEKTLVEQTESQDDNSPLDSNERQELGRLRNEKIKWDASIKVALEIGRWLASVSKKIKKAEFDNKVYRLNSKLPNSTRDKIWSIVSSDYKNTAGRPKKS